MILNPQMKGFQRLMWGLSRRCPPAIFLTSRYTQLMRHLVDIGSLAEKEVIQ